MAAPGTLSTVTIGILGVGAVGKHCKHPLHAHTFLYILYTASEVKHLPSIFSDTVFRYDFLQKNNQVVIYCYRSIF